MEKKFYKALAKRPFMYDIFNDFEYELNKTYNIEDTNMDSFEFVTDIIFAVSMCIGPCAIFEVVPGTVQKDDDFPWIYNSSELTVVRQLSEEEIINTMNDECDKFVNSHDWRIRNKIACYGREKDRDLLEKDPNSTVRTTAKQNRGGYRFSPLKKIK